MRIPRLVHALLVCASVALPSWAARAGCTKDNDCKGARICTSGVCVDPLPSPAQVPQAGVRAFVGTASLHMPDGREPTTLRQWLRVTLDPAAHSIVTRFLAFDAAGAPLADASTTWHVEGTHAVIIDSTLGIRGQAELGGPAWKWTKFTSHEQLPDGRMNDITQTWDDQGLDLQATTKDAQGMLQSSSSGRFRNATASEFDGAVGAFAAARAPQAPPPPAPVPAAPVPSDSEQTSGGWGQNCWSGNIPCTSGRTIGCYATLPEEHSQHYRGQCTQHTGSVGWVRCGVYDRQGNVSNAFSNQCP